MIFVLLAFAAGFAVGSLWFGGPLSRRARHGLIDLTGRTPTRRNRLGR